MIIDESRKKCKFKLPDNQKFRKYGDITYTDETWTIRESNKFLLLLELFFSNGSNRTYYFTGISLMSI